MGFSDLPTAGRVALIALIAVQLALQVTALVVLVRTRPERLTLPRWAWALVVVLGSLAGVVVFLVAGRRPVTAAVDDPPASGTGGSSDGAIDRAVDVLYRDRP